MKTNLRPKSRDEFASSTVQGILGYSRIQTTLDLYPGEDLGEMIAAQEKLLDAWDSKSEECNKAVGEIVGRLK